MAILKWDESGKREFEAGVKNVVLFPMLDNRDTTNNTSYDDGVAWDGVTQITENPGGADKTELYADDIKYAILRAAETFGFTIEAYQYPDEWAACDGSAEGATGVFLGQQNRRAFGLAYITSIGDDQHPGMDKGYKLHLIYNCSCAPSSRSYVTINNNPDAITFSWEADSTPVACTNHKAVSSIVIDSTKANATDLTALKGILFGTENTDPRLPDPDEVITRMSTTNG